MPKYYMPHKKTPHIIANISAKIPFWKKAHGIAFVFLVLLTLFLRFYNVPNRYGLGEETVRDAVIGIEGARQLQLPLTGAFSSLGPFTFGPLYQYQLAFASLIGRHVYAPWYYLGVMSVLYVIIMYAIGKKLYDERFGLLLGFLACISPAQIISAQHLTSHNMTNIFAALAIYVFLILAEKQKSYWWTYCLGIVIGIGMNLHYQMVGLVLLPVVLWIRNPKRIMILLSSILGIITTFLPWIFFELNFQWFNVSNMIDYMIYGRTRMYVPNSWRLYVGSFWPGFWADALGVPVFFAKIIIAGVTGTLSYLVMKKKLSVRYLSLVVVFIFNFILLRYYWGPRFYGYLNFLRPFIFIFTALVLYHIWNIRRVGKIITVVCLILLILYPFNRIKSELASDTFSKQMFERMNATETAIHKSHYTIYSCHKTYDGGYFGEALSAVFISELHNLHSPTGKKIALEKKDCPLPFGAIAINPSTIRMLDLSEASPAGIEQAGWKEVTFASIYDQYARWWKDLR